MKLEPIPLPDLENLRSLGRELAEDSHFRAFFDLVNVPCMIYHAERVAFVNPAFTRLLGWEPKEVVGKHWRELVAVPPPHDEQVEQWAALGGEGGQVHPIGYNTKDGQRVDLVASWRTDDGTGTSYGVFFPTCGRADAECGWIRGR